MTSRCVMVLLATIAFQLAFSYLSAATPHPYYKNFSEPLVAFSLNSTDVAFTSGDEIASLEVSAKDFAVYRYAYVSLDGSDWIRTELSGKNLGGDWLNGSVSAQITMEASDLGLAEPGSSAARNYVVVYSCSRTANAWDCHGGWQIWQFNAIYDDEKPPVVYAVNAGGDAYIGSEGVSYSADAYYSGGQAFESGQPIEGTDDDALYSSERFRDFSYHFPVEDGDYDVTIEGALSVKDLDLYQTAGYLQAYNVTRDVTVTDGSLDIAFSASVDFPKLSAIVIRGDNPPPECASHASSACYGGDVYWYDSCGNIENVRTDCSLSETCAGGQCIAEEPGPATGDLVSTYLDGVPVIHAQTFVIPENAVAGDTVGDINLMWKGPGQSIALSLSDDDDGRFSIEPTGRISVAAADFDFDSQPERQLTVRATEPGSGEYNDALIPVLLTRTEDTTFIDPSWTGCHDGSRECPYSSWKTGSSASSTSITTEEGHAYLQKRGTVYSNTFYVRASGTPERHMIIGSYGSGDRAEMDCSSYPDEQGIFLGIDYSHDGSGTIHYVDLYSFSVHGCNGIRTSYGDTYLTLRDLDVYDNTDNGGIYIWHDVQVPWPTNQNAYDQHILLEDIVSHGNNRASVHGIKAHPGGLTARNLLLYNNGGHGISVGSRYTDISYVISHDNGVAGGGGSVEIGSSNTKLSYVVSYDNYYGVQINENATDINVSHVVVYDNYQAGIEFDAEGASYVNLDDVDASGSNWGIEMRDQTEHVTIRNTNLHDNGGGVYMREYGGYYPVDIHIDGNTIRDNEGHGVNLNVARDVFITNNVFSGNGGDDIYMSGSATNVEESGNTFL